jgi:hypothetical protein
MPVDFGLELRLSYLRAAQNAIEDEEAKLQLYRDFFDGDQTILTASEISASAW